MMVGPSVSTYRSRYQTTSLVQGERSICAKRERKRLQKRSQVRIKEMSESEPFDEASRKKNTHCQNPDVRKSEG